MARGASRAAKAVGIGNRLAPPRFILFLVALIAAWFAHQWWFPSDDWRDGAAMAFDAAALVFLVSLAPLLKDCSAEEIREHARDNDANRGLILGITSLLTVVAMAAITAELQGAQSGEWLPIAKLVATLLLVWAFANSIYALHYAHAFYATDEKSGGDVGGFDFPGTKTPDYWDFAYFAFTLGMTFQTSDVAITATGVRKIALLHSFAAFVFNIGVIAFTINVLGGSS
ncbi:DUF1345 domain-containing protein [Tsuneonella rigui]|uniref:DUF1345 domain-containing protein n=1 Tax=Tsuneonella rigui TaxID=1708790 RepID=UPI001F4977E5|nr:DUF1345 domain-containing protein [Tsuneonella rigui]